MLAAKCLMSRKQMHFFKLMKVIEKHEKVISCIIYYISCMIFHESNFYQQNPANIYLFKVNDRKTEKMCEICSKSTIKTPDRRQ